MADERTAASARPEPGSGRTAASPREHSYLLYASHEEAEYAIQALLACLPEVLFGIMVDQHQRWLDGEQPTSEEDFKPLFDAKLRAMFERKGGGVELPNVSLSHEELGLAIDGVARLVQSPDAEAAPLLHKLQKAYRG